MSTFVILSFIATIDYSKINKKFLKIKDEFLHEVNFYSEEKFNII